MTAIATAAVLLGASSLAASLFPEPLHIVRSVDDPITGTTAMIEEYCSGDRVITVRGAVVVIADYARQELTEIDRNAATFSITPFADLARAGEALYGGQTAMQVAADPRPLGARLTADGRQIDAYEFAYAGAGERIVVSVGVDRALVLPPDALQVLIGAAFPNRKSIAHDAMLRAAAPDPSGRRMQSESAPALALPSEHVVTYESGTERLTFRSTVVAVDRKLPPPDVLTIPPGSRRVESRIVAVPRVLEEVEGVIKPQQR